MRASLSVGERVKIAFVHLFFPLLCCFLGMSRTTQFLVVCASCMTPIIVFGASSRDGWQPHTRGREVCCPQEEFTVLCF